MSAAAMAAQAALIMLMGSAMLTFTRLLRGPSLADRVIAFDLLTIHVLGIICSTAILTGRSLFLDVAIVLALLTFLATIAFARFIERRLLPDGDSFA